MTRDISAPTGENQHISILASLDGFYLENRAEAEPKGRWTITGREEDGLNIHYHVSLMRPEPGGYQLTLPWSARQSCPACQGRGQNFTWSPDDLFYEESLCPECGGAGFLENESEISLSIDGSLDGLRAIRKSRAGLYNPSLKLRGDLIINITWVSENEEQAGPTGQA